VGEELGDACITGNYWIQRPQHKYIIYATKLDKALGLIFSWNNLVESFVSSILQKLNRSCLPYLIGHLKNLSNVFFGRD
jgi:hypothetical protein